MQLLSLKQRCQQTLFLFLSAFSRFPPLFTFHSFPFFSKQNLNCLLTQLISIHEANNQIQMNENDVQAMDLKMIIMGMITPRLNN